MPIEADEYGPIYVYLSVRDSGPGLHPKDLELLVSGRHSNNAHLAHLLLVPEVPAGFCKYGLAVWVPSVDHKHLEYS